MLAISVPHVRASGLMANPHREPFDRLLAAQANIEKRILVTSDARVTDAVLRTLVLATYLLAVDRVLIMPHTDCRMASGDEGTIHASIQRLLGIDTKGIEFRMVADQRAALISVVEKIRAYAMLPKNLAVAGAILDVHSGRLELVDC